MKEKPRWEKKIMRAFWRKREGERRRGIDLRSEAWRARIRTPGNSAVSVQSVFIVFLLRGRRRETKNIKPNYEEKLGTYALQRHRRCTAQVLEKRPRTPGKQRVCTKFTKFIEPCPGSRESRESVPVSADALGVHTHRTVSVVTQQGLRWRAEEARVRWEWVW